jgi:hypothetical protein
MSFKVGDIVRWHTDDDFVVTYEVVKVTAHYFSVTRPNFLSPIAYNHGSSHLFVPVRSKAQRNLPEWF